MISCMCESNSGRVIPDGRCAKGLASAMRIKCIHFVGCTGQGTDFAGTPKAPEWLKRGRLPTGGPFTHRRLSVDEIHRNNLESEF